jgi:hypothetical protein
MSQTASQRPKKGADLSAIFSQAAQMLAANQSSLNAADVDNRNHGDNMVQTFNMISQAMASQRGAPPSQQLQHASEYVAQNAASGSGQIYAHGLAQAAQQFQGQAAVTPENAMMLIQSLLGGGQGSQQGSADVLGSLLGGQQPAQSQGIDLGALLSAGMTFMSAKQQGQGNVQAALTALMSGGPLAQRQHRQQSGQLVGNALLQAIAGMSRRR